MWFNSTVSEEPHQGLKLDCIVEKFTSLRGCLAGVARSSSARAVRCSVKSGNERNPYRVLLMSRETAPDRIFKLILKILSGEEGGDDVRSAWPFDALGYTRATMAGTKGC